MLINENSSRYINPYTDFGFKKLFGVEANKDVLIDFLNELLQLESPIKDIAYKGTENFAPGIDERKAVFDVYCQSEDGGGGHRRDAEGDAAFLHRPQHLLLDVPDPGAGEEGDVGLSAVGGLHYRNP